MQVAREEGRAAAEPDGERRRFRRWVALEVARVGPGRCRLEECRGALIEDRSASGVCLRSGLEVRAGDRVALFVGGEALSGEVVWARVQGVFVDDRSGKPGRAYVAGCRIRQRRERFSLADWLRSRSWPDVVTQVVRGGVVVAGVGVLGALLYWGISLLSLMR